MANVPLGPTGWLEFVRQKAPELASDARKWALPVLDATAAMGSGLASSAVAGAAAIPYMLPGGRSPQEVLESVQGALPAYTPQTEGGKAILEAYGQPGGVMEKLDAPFKWVGDQSYEGAKGLGLPDEAAAALGALGYVGSGAVVPGPEEIARTARAFPGIVKDAAIETAAAGAQSKIWSPRVKPESQAAYEAALADGADELTALQKTGVFRDAAGDLREFIPDVGTTWNGRGGNIGKVSSTGEEYVAVGPLTGEFELNPEIVSRFPELAKTNVFYRDSLKPGQGGLSGDGKQLQLSRRQRGNVRRGSDAPEDLIQVGLHETMHAVDEAALGRSGTSPDAQPIEPHWAEMDAALQNAIYAHEHGLVGNPDATIIVGEKGAALAQKVGVDELRDTLSQLRKSVRAKRFERYQQNLGEALARSTEDLYKRGITDASQIQSMDEVYNGVPRDKLWWEGPDGKPVSAQKAEELLDAVSKREGDWENVVRGYKLLRVDESRPGQLFPLFVDANTPIPQGQWIQASDAYHFIDPKNGRPYVPAKTGGTRQLTPELQEELARLGHIRPGSKTTKAVAYRPGWHAGNLPFSHHLGVDPQKIGGKQVLTRRGDDQVWAEILMPDDVDWQSVANANASRLKDGRIDVKTAQVTDQVPHGGFYRYKTNPNMVGDWMISGDMKINRLLSDREVERMNLAAGVKDLPRRQPFDFDRYGLEPPEELADPKSRAYRGYRGEHGEPGDGLQSRGPGYTFSDSPEVASQYATLPNRRGDTAVAPRVTRANLDIKRPIINSEDPFVDFADIAKALGPEQAAHFARKHAGFIEQTDNWMSRGLDDVESALAKNPALLDELYMDAYPLLDDPEFVDAARAAGYDGAIHGGNGTGAGTMEYRIFDENQADFSFDDPKSLRDTGDETLSPGAYQAADADEFNAALARARDQMDARSALQVDAKLPDDFKGQVFLTPDGMSGFAVSDSGYVSNLFKHPSAAYKDVMGAALARARAEGGKTLDAFDTGLATGYAKRGAVETGRSPWNPEYAPQGWDEATMGTPDYVAMDIGHNPAAYQGLTVRLDPNMQRVSAIGILDDPNMPALPRGTHTVASLAKMFTQAAKKAWGSRDMTKPTARNIEDVSTVLAAEIEAAMNRTGHAGTWYSETLEKAHQVADKIWNGAMADPVKRAAFNFALAITSNGQSVALNTRLAAQAFDHYMQHGVFPRIGGGKEASAMMDSFDRYNMLSKELGEAEFQRFMETEYTVEQLRAAGFDIPEELPDTRVPGSIIFGPKIGGGFYANLSGDFSRLTSDRWLTRTLSRIIGDIDSYDAAEVARQRASFAAALEKAGLRVPKTNAALYRQAAKLHKQFARGEATIVNGKKKWISYPKSMRNELNRAAKRLDEARSKRGKETPASPQERKYYRDIVTRAKDKLRENGIETTVSDSQALVWYPEQDLYRKLGYAAKPDSERDYFEALKAVAREKGVDIGDAGNRPGANPGNAAGKGAGRRAPAGAPQEALSFLESLGRIQGKNDKQLKRLRSLFDD